MSTSEEARTPEPLPDSLRLLSRIMAASRDCIKVLDLEGRLLYMNEGGMRELEICDLGPVLHTSWIEFWQGEHREAARVAIETARKGDLARFIGYFPTVETHIPKWFEVVVCPILDARGEPERLLAVSRDITQRRRAEERERTLLEINNAIISNLTQEDLFRAVTGALGRLIPSDRGTIFVHRQGTDTLRLFVLQSTVPSAEFRGNLDIAMADTPAGRVFQSGRTMLRRDLSQEAEFPTERRLLAEGFRSLIIAPLVARGRVVGTLNLLSTEPGKYTDSDAEFVREVATQVGLAVENMNAFEQITALKAQLEADNVYLREEIGAEHNFQEIVGSSPALLAVLRKVEQIAPTDSTVLILGETGSGKELIARALHDRSPRKGRPLVKVNCSAISAGLVESELFGHVKGAFTGAIERRIGRFQLADSGAIFLDEVGDLPLETQVKLLRVLQEQEFEPVGSDRTARVNVRILAATNRNLEDAVREGRFRSDLFYRLNVLPLRLPPLRERIADIPQLTALFIDRVSKRYGKDVRGVSKATMDVFLRYAWPGNVRELQNVIERGVVLARGPVLTLDPHMLPAADSGGAAPPGDAAANALHGAAALPAGESLEDVEREHIRLILSRTGGVVEGPKGAAAILNLHPNTLRSRMKKLGIAGRRSAVNY